MGYEDKRKSDSESGSWYRSIFLRNKSTHPTVFISKQRLVCIHFSLIFVCECFSNDFGCEIRYDEIASKRFNILNIIKRREKNTSSNSAIKELSSADRLIRFCALPHWFIIKQLVEGVAAWLIAVQIMNIAEVRAIISNAENLGLGARLNFTLGYVVLQTSNWRWLESLKNA